MAIDRVVARSRFLRARSAIFRAIRWSVSIRNVRIDWEFFVAVGVGGDDDDDDDVKLWLLLPLLLLLLLLA